MSQTLIPGSGQGWTPEPGMDPKAAAKAAKAYAKATRPWYRKKRFIGLGVILLIVIIAVASSGSGKGAGSTTTASTSDQTGVVSHLSGSSSHPAVADVKISSCTKDGLDGAPKAVVKVTNHSSGTSNYVITVAFVHGSEQIDTGDVAVENLGPGQTATQDADSFKTDGVPATFTCRVAQVDRYAS